VPYDREGEIFYLYAMKLFFKAGHVSTLEPVFANHSPERFFYFDNKTIISLSEDQRALFRSLDNISLLFSQNGSSFFSIDLQTEKSGRGQLAHDIHEMIHPIVGSDGTICLFRYDNEVMLSFMGYGYHCILSDWYPIEDEYDHLQTRLDIANMSIDRREDYFSDMIYMLARSYYITEQPSVYEILPIDFISSAGLDGIDREEIDRIVEYELSRPEGESGNDYVEYDKSSYHREEKIGTDLDLMLLEMDEDEENPFEEEIEPEDDVDEDEHDEYEFDEVDPEIFKDPTLLVKWLNKADI
jgi:hypothetical protein